MSVEQLAHYLGDHAGIGLNEWKLGSDLKLSNFYGFILNLMAPF